MAPEAPRDWLAAHAETLDADAMQAARVVPRLAEAGLFRLGVPRESGVEGGIADAVEAIARVAEHSLAAAFTFWGQRAFIEYPLQSPNAALRERWLPSLLDGTRSGATGLSNAMKFLGGIEALAIHARTRPDDEGWVLQKPHAATTAELAETVTDLLAMPRFRLQSREAVQDAVRAPRAAKTGKAGFADFLVMHVALREGCDTVVRFDRAAIRLVGMTAVEGVADA